MTSPGFKLPYVTNGASGGEVTHNKALNIIDVLIGLEIEGFDTNTPPGSPTNGQSWKVGGSPTGAWASNADDIAIWNDGWGYAETKQGMLLFDPASGTIKRLHDKGTDAWVEYGEQAAEVTPITDSTGGTAGASIGAAGGAYSQSYTNDALATIIAKQSAIITALRNANLMA